MSRTPILRAVPASDAASVSPTAALQLVERAAASLMAEDAKLRSLEPLRRPPAAIGAADRAQALAQRTRLLSRADYGELLATFRQSVSAPARREAVLVLVATLIDAYPTQKIANPAVYLHALVEDLTEERFSEPAVAAACRQLRRTTRFAPAISEVLEACRAKRATFDAIESSARWYLARLNQIHAVLHRTGGDPCPVEARTEVVDPLFIDAYRRGADNEFWFDLAVNPELSWRPDDETEEEWEVRVRALLADGEANPGKWAIPAAQARGRYHGERLLKAHLRNGSRDPHQRTTDDLRRERTRLKAGGMSDEEWRAYALAALARMGEVLSERAAAQPRKG
jgi:hypothetical protein